MKETNKLFLLSIKEYKRFKKNIPLINNWWWLRSPSDSSKYVASVVSDGFVYENGSDVYDEDVAVRPAFVVTKEKKYKVGDLYNPNSFPMVCIGESKKYYWFIAKTPMTLSKFDDETNNYDESYIKNDLLPRLQNIL